MVEADNKEGTEESTERQGGGGRARKVDILYEVDQRPPWPLAFLLALQQFLTMFGSTFSLPMLMAGALCLNGDTVGLSQLISTVIFVSGLGTLLQTTFGVRLPIIQSISASFATPFIALLSLPTWKCPGCVTEVDPSANTTQVECAGQEHRGLWQARLRELQGAILVSSAVQIVLGFSGLVGLLMRFIGPLTVAPTIALIGLSLFDLVAIKSQSHWWISLMTLALIAIFSQYLRNVNIPFCHCRRGPDGTGCTRVSFRFFSLFPIILAVGLAWLLCYLLTEFDVLPTKKGQWGYGARTDTKTEVLSLAPWFRFPYPGQWGVPTVSLAGVLSGIAAVIASVVESVGDYYACARISGAPPPPRSAVSRGIGMEGITCLLAGAWGSSGGLTSYSQNTGAIGITKVASRMVFQITGVLLLVLACVGKFSAVFVAVPDPIVGGLFFAMFGMITAVGLSNLQYVDLSSTRNMFVLGVSLFLGLTVPKWVASPANAGAIDTGSTEADQVLKVLCSTSMLVGGVVAFIMDNTIPGTPEERGLVQWNQHSQDKSDLENDRDLKIYDLPFVQSWLNRKRFTSYLPFCPGFPGDKRGRHKYSVGSQQANGEVNGGYEENAVPVCFKKL